MPWKLHIEKVNDSIALKRTNDNGSTYTAITYHHISAIRSIVPDGVLNFAPRQADNNRKFTYPYTNKWRITLNFTSENGTIEVFDIQDVINQAGWTNNQAGFNQALLDINSWLASSSSAAIEASLEVIEEALSGTVTPDTIDLSGETFPYAFPADTYLSCTVIVPTGETIEFNGMEFGPGTYSFSGEGSQTLDSFTLSAPSATPTSVILLVTQ